MSLRQSEICYKPIVEAYNYVGSQGLKVVVRQPHDPNFKVEKGENMFLEVSCQLLSDEGKLVGEWEGYEIRELKNGEYSGVALAPSCSALVEALTAMGGLYNL